MIYFFSTQWIHEARLGGKMILLLSALVMWLRCLPQTRNADFDMCVDAILLWVH